MSQTADDKISKISGTSGKPIMELEPILELYYLRYDHKNKQLQKSDILLYGMLIAAIHNLDVSIPVSIQRLAEITFSEVIDIQEHLPLLLEVYPGIGEYHVREQVFVLN